MLREIGEHLDDLARELRAAGLSEAAAEEEALRRVGDASAIAEAFMTVRPATRGPSRFRWLRSPAWIAVAAMSLVTAWAAELPQASGAKATVHPAQAPQVGGSPRARWRAGNAPDQRSRVSVRRRSALHSP